MGRQTGKYGEIWLPVNDGIQLTGVDLTLAATKKIGGIEYANRFLGHAASHWNKAKGYDARIQGISGGPTIAPTAVNNEVAVSEVKYYKDLGAIQTAPADASVTVTRPAATKVKVNAIVLDMDDGLISAVAGLDGDAFSDVFGAAGGPPFVDADKLIIGFVKLSSDAAAPVLATEIAFEDSAGKLIQERFDIPGFEFVPLDGGILLYEALLGSRTGGVSRKAFASFWSQKSAMQKKGHSTNWSYEITRGSVAFAAQNDIAVQKDLAGSPEWSGSAGFFAVDNSLKKLAAESGTCFLRLYRNRNEATYEEGAAIITGYSEDCNVDGAITGELSFEGDGALESRP